MTSKLVNFGFQICISSFTSYVIFVSHWESVRFNFSTINDKNDKINYQQKAKLHSLKKESTKLRSLLSLNIR